MNITSIRNTVKETDVLYYAGRSNNFLMLFSLHRTLFALLQENITKE